jgi:hypothetical protein
MRSAVLLFLATKLVQGPSVAAAQQAAPPIADNSFLMEEAYNQEHGVVQHISGFLWRERAKSWLYTFTQEWPLGGQTHQLSYTVPIQRVGGRGGVTRLGDMVVNYRYQLLSRARTAIAPRVSILLPTGNKATGNGAGTAGVQVNLPLSVFVTQGLVTHWNAGATAIDGVTYNLGASAIWLLRPRINLLVETVWSGAPGRDSDWRVMPGVRWAHNFPSGLQIVPGVGYVIGLGPSRGDDALFFYLSFEHPFTRRGA